MDVLKNKYLNPRNYARRFFALANQYALGRVESMFVQNSDEPLRHPPIFFLGAPRSGSTLMIQVITDALEVGYISNHHCHWFGAPALAERLFRPTARRSLSDYKSEQGVTSSPYAPAECGEWWYRFFRRRPAYVSLDDVEPKKMLAFRRSVGALTNTFDRPILFKNLYASLRIQAIAKYLPESLFIVTHRDEVDNGHSLLDARYQEFKNYDAWLSVEPPNVEILMRLPAHEQVIEQIRHIHNMIENDLKIAAVPASRRFDLCYEDFCADPCGKIDDVQRFLATNGCKVEKKEDVPQEFKRSDEVKIDPDVYAAMSNYVRKSQC